VTSDVEASGLHYFIATFDSSVVSDIAPSRQRQVRHRSASLLVAELPNANGEYRADIIARVRLLRGLRATQQRRKFKWEICHFIAHSLI
jgi:hypothetical protein